MMIQQGTGPIPRVVGALLFAGGIWHAAAPATFGYAAVTALLIGNIVAGAALAAVGVGLVVFRGARALNWAGAALGVWILIGPDVLVSTPPVLSQLEATWGGLLTLALIAIAAYDRRYNRTVDRPERGPAIA